MKQLMLQWFEDGFNEGLFDEQPKDVLEYIKYTIWDEFLVMEFNNYASTQIEDYNDYVDLKQCRKLSNKIILDKTKQYLSA